MIIRQGRGWPRRGLRLVSLACAVTALVLVGGGQPAFAETRRQQQWHIEYLKITQVHQISRGQGVVVAVVDSGVDAGHPDLAGRVLPGLRSDGSSDNGSTDEDGHGTSMASDIAAINAGQNGVLGVAPAATILPIKTGLGTADPTHEAIARGIRMAADHGAKVINVSSAGSGPALDAEDIRYALSKDAVIVAGAGNTNLGQSTVMWPAKVPGVIAATGFDRNGSFWSGSTQGPEAVLAAPAKDIVHATSRTKFQSGYAIGEGTSSASAIISGVVALVRAKYPNLDAANVIQRLIATADDAGPTGRDPQYGFGKINALRALTADVPTVTSNPLLTAANTSASSDADNVVGDVPSFEGDGKPPIGELLTSPAGLTIGALVLLLATAGIVVVVRRRRRAAPPLPTGQGQPFGAAASPPMTPPQGHPSAATSNWPPPAGWPPGSQPSAPPPDGWPPPSSGGFPPPSAR